VLAARRLPVAVGRIVAVENMVHAATCMRRCQALELCTDLAEPHTLFEDEMRVELKVHKPGSLLMVGQVGTVMSFDQRECGIVVAVSRWDREVVTVAEQGPGSTGRASARWVAAYLQPGISKKRRGGGGRGTTKQRGGSKYLAEGCKSFVEGSLEERRRHRH
jgi:hypothetical protein